MKHIKKILSAITALALVLSLSGCYWEGKTKWHSELIVLNELEERYNEEFVIRQIGVSSARSGRPIVAYCSPKDDEEIIFETAVYQFGDSGGYYLEDTYIPMIVRREMKEKIDTVLAKYYDDYAVEVKIASLATGHDSGITNAEEVSIATYMEVANKGGLTYIFIALNQKDFNDYSEIQNALVECAENLENTFAVIECYFADNKTIEDCKVLLTNDNYDNLEIATVLSPGKCVTEKIYVMHKYRYDDSDHTLCLSEIVDANGKRIIGDNIILNNHYE